MNKEKKNREGSVLTIIIMMSVILSIMAGALTQLVQVQSKMSYRDENRIKALFLAEAGFAEVHSLLDDNWNEKDDPDNFGTTSLGEGTYTTFMEEGIDYRYYVRSVGTVNGVSRTIYAEVDYVDYYAAFKYASFSNKDTTLGNLTNITGDSHSNDDINISGWSYLNGIASAVNDVNIAYYGGAAAVNEGVDPKIFPEFDFNVYYNLADPSDRYTGDISFNNQVLAPVNGVIYVNGNVEMYNDIDLTGCVIATGYIRVNGTLAQHALPDLPALMSRDSHVIFYDYVDVEDGLVYSGGGSVVIWDDFNIKGSLVAKKEVYIVGWGTVLSQTVSETLPLGLIVDESKQGFRVVTYHE